MGFFQRMAYKFRSFMAGRYGTDALGMALLIFGLLLYGVLSFVRVPWIILLSYIPYILFLLRFFSKNRERRCRENEAFQKILAPVTGAFRRARDPYKYFRCPGCGLRLRAPHGRGKIQVRCQRCGKEFVKKT